MVEVCKIVVQSTTMVALAVFPILMASGSILTMTMTLVWDSNALSKRAASPGRPQTISLIWYYCATLRWDIVGGQNLERVEVHYSKVMVHFHFVVHFISEVLYRRGEVRYLH